MVEQRDHSDSAVQSRAQQPILQALGRRLGVEVKAATIPLPDGSRVEVDGHAEEPSLLVEVCAHHGALKAGQVRKLLADALKLVAVRKLVKPDARILIVVPDEAAARGLRTGWRRAALEALSVEVVVVTLPSELSSEVWAAQQDQEDAMRGRRAV